MDKQEYSLKTRQMLDYMRQKSYKQAMSIADEMDWKKVKNTSMLCAVSEVYECNEEYQKSRDVLFLAYDRTPDSRKIVYRLGTLALKLGEVKEARDCYEEFVSLAPKDPNQYILKYKILRGQNAGIGEQIEALETFKKVEYVEKWAFELAKLYQEAGMTAECIEECDDLALWFSEGKYVRKAMELKMQYKPLTPLQQEKYNQQKKAEEAPESVDTVAEAGAETVTETEVETEVEEPQEDMADMAEEKREEGPTLSIGEMLQEWEEKQKENAELIRAKVEEAETEKAVLEAAAEAETGKNKEGETESILLDDIRQLMEELESESADIEEKKEDLQQEAQEEAVLAEGPKTAAPEETPKMTITAAVPNMAIPAETGKTQEPETPDIRLGDTQSMAAVAKALKNHVEMEPYEEPEEEPLEDPEISDGFGDKYDTGFIVQGRYDLESRSAIGIKAGLTEEQKKLFSYFVPVRGVSEQIVEVLQNDKECRSRYGTSRTGNVLIIGRKGSGKTVLAVDIVKAIQKNRKQKQGKVGIVKAESLNKKDVKEILEKLRGGAIIIERASKLSRKSVAVLCEVMEGQTGELLVVLEDERKPVEKFFEAYPQFGKKFTSRIELPVFINDELVTFGQTYAKENGYKIDEMGILALYSRIDALQRNEHVVTVADVKDVVDEAIDHAQKVNLKRLVKKVFGGHKDKSDRILLREEDFR